MKAHLCFVLSNAALAMFAWRLTRGLAGRERPCTGSFLAVAAFALGILAVMVTAGMCGQLRAGPVTGGACLLASVGWVVTRRRWVPARGPRVVDGDDAQFRALGRALLAALGTVAALKVLTRGTQFFSDDFGYHALPVNVWLREGRFALMALTFSAYYPLHSELFAAWFCLPYGHDAWAGLAGALWLLLAALGVGAVAEITDLRLSAGALAAALLLASNHIWFMVRSFAATDLAVGSALFAAVIVTAHAAHAGSTNCAGRRLRERWPVSRSG